MADELWKRLVKDGDKAAASKPVDVAEIIGQPVFDRLTALVEPQPSFPVVTTSEPAEQVFGYGVFVNKLKQRVDEAKHFEDEDRKHASMVFVAWKHALTDLLDRIRVVGYNVNTGVVHRHFVDSFGTTLQSRKAFDRDLDTTIMEMELVISNHAEFGPPTKSRQALAKEAADVVQPVAATVVVKTEAGWPDKLTFPWLWKHMPPGLTFTVLGTMFGIGVAVGNWEPIKNLFLLAVKHFS